MVVFLDVKQDAWGGEPTKRVRVSERGQTEGAMVVSPWRKTRQMPVWLEHEDTELHPMMQHVLAHREGKNSKRFLAGIKMPFKAVAFLLKRPKLWPLVAVPAAINFTLFSVGVYLTWGWSSALMEWLWAYPVVEAWYHWGLVALWWVVAAAAKIGVIVLTYFGALAFGGVLASPFNDALSQQTEKLLLGSRFVEPPNAAFVPSTVRSIGSSALMATLHLAATLPLLLLNFVPVAGAMAATVASMSVGALFVSMEYTDTLLERRQLSLREKWRAVWDQRPFALGFGAGTNLMLAIPLLNFLCIPIAVVAGTAVGIGLDQWDALPSPAPGPASDDDNDPPDA